MNRSSPDRSRTNGGFHEHHASLAYRGRLVRQLQLRRRVCESVLFWHIQRGQYGDVNLNGLSFVRVGRWEGDLWAGKAKGAAGLFIDDRVDERQAEALQLIIGGRVGGFPAVWGALFPEGRQLRGVEPARITFEIAPDRAHWGAEIAGKVKAWAKALTGPTSLPGKYPQLMNAPGCETGPRPTARNLGQVNDLLRGCVRLQIPMDDEFEQAHPVRLDRPVIGRARHL